MEPALSSLAVRLTPTARFLRPLLFTVMAINGHAELPRPPRPQTAVIMMGVAAFAVIQGADH